MVRANGLHRDEKAAHEPVEAMRFRRTEARLQGVFQQAAVGMAEILPDGRIMAANEKLYHLLGYDPEELAGQAYRKITLEEDWPCLEAEIRRLWSGEIDSCLKENRSLRKDGTIVWTQTTCSIVHDEPPYMLAVVEDITERKRSEEAMLQAQERYAALFDRSMDCVYLHDFQGHFLDANPALLKLLGYSREEVPSLTFASVLDPHETQKAMQLVEQMTRSDHMEMPVEFNVKAKNGQNVRVEIRSSVIFHQGHPFAIQGIARDITGRKIMEEALRESEEKFRTLAESAHCNIGIVQGERFVYANQYFANSSGYTVEELLTMDFPHLVHPAFRDIMIDRARRRQRGEPAPSSYEFMMLTKSGETRWIDFSAARAIYRGQPAVIGTGFDITERKHAETALRESEMRRRLLAETATRLIKADHPDEVLGDIFQSVAGQIGAEVFINYLVTPDGRRLHLHSSSGLDDAARRALEFTEFNQSFCGTAARERRSIVVPHVQTCSLPKAVPLQSLGLKVYVCFPLMDDAVLGTISFCSREKEEFSEEALGIMGAVADQVSLALARQRLTEALKQRAAALDDASRAKDHFLAVLSHELRNPLNPVLATASMLRDDPHYDADTHEQLEVICRNAELEARLIDDLLDITRIERGKVELDRQPVELRTVIHQAAEVCLPDIEARKLKLGVDLGTAPYWVDADAARLLQVFWNLLKNAIKFTPVDGCVGIRCRREGESFVAVDVTDSGEGIEPAAMERIFHAFEQAERSITRQFGGLGLGLTISKAMVEMHGGTIHAYSAGKGQGATFTVRLPLLPTPAAAPTTGDTVGPPSPEHRRSRPLRILLVEDHGDTARIMNRLLSAHGHRVQLAADVATALALAEEHPFDLMISDLGLPDGSGLDLMRTLHARGHNVPSIALSGFGQEQDMHASHEAGFAVHLVKPVAVPKLEEAIARVAGRK